MLDYLKNFLTPGNLFNLRPDALANQTAIKLAITFGFFIALAIISKLLTKTKDALKAKGYQRLFNLFLTMGIIGYVYLFFAWQGAALLAAKFWLLIWLVTTLVWLAFALKYLFKEAPSKRKEINEKRKFEKYIP